MEEFKLPSKNSQTILALGAESAGNFSAYQKGVLYFSEDFGDLLEETNFTRFKLSLQTFMKKEKLRPAVILSDLHPLFLTTRLAEKLAKKYKAKHIPIQHHLAHIFSAIGDKIIQNPKKPRSYSLKSCLGIACDGTGYGFDGKIWGGEIFKLETLNHKLKLKRVGHLENQLMLGGEMATREPARMLISILSEFLEKDAVYPYVKKYYTRNEFEVLYNQLQQNFNCPKTSSTARILDAAAVLLGFSKNQRLQKHGPSEALEKNSTKPYVLKPKIIETYDNELRIMNYELCTTFLFEYLIRNLHRDKKRLAATAQHYIAAGLYEITKKNHDSKFMIHNSYFSGGMANNKIMSTYLESQGFHTNKKIPRGDAGISFGQIIYHLYIKNGRT